MAVPKKSKTIPLIVRNATQKDVPAIHKLSEKVYPGYAFPEEKLKAHITNFPAGQFVVEYEGQIIGHCATFVIDGKIALAPHSWSEITGNGYAARHNPDGDYLYGFEVVVDPDQRGKRIGSRLYQCRKKLCQELGLQGIVFGGRIPGYHRRKKDVGSPEEYLERVKARKIRDPVIFFQLSNEFEIIGVLENYLPFDKESEGYAAHMLWKNPLQADPVVKDKTRRQDFTESVRVATVQFQMRKVDTEQQFQNQLEYFIDIASNYRSDFVIFPELVTLALLSATTNKMRPEESLDHLTDYTARYIEFLKEMAISYNINIIGGSHPTKMPDGDIHNICYVCLRNGEVYAQEKLHPTPNERYWWNIQGGDKLETIPTDCGPIGVLICYDTEFPETARHLVDQGALMIFVPFCTDERQGYLRVRYCSQAIAVQNQCYVIMSGTVGNIPDVENMDINYAESCVLTPCDFPFARDGIAAICTANTETIAFADLHMPALLTARQSGTVQNLKDRRFDLYQITWKNKG